MNITILDPDSTDPTWGPTDEAITLKLTQHEWDKLDTGVWTIAMILSERKRKTLERVRKLQGHA